MFHCDDIDTDSVLTSVRVRLALLVRTRPTADMVVALDAIDASRLGPIDAVTYLQALSRVSSWLASRRNNALVAAASPTRQVEECRLIQPDNDDERRILIADVAREEIAAALRLSPATAQRQMDAARLLAGPLSDTAAALARGEISQSHADVLVEHAGRLPGAAAVLCGDGSVLERKGFERSCATLQSRVLPTARASTVSRTRAQANRVILAIDAEGVQRRRRAAMCTRDVYVSDQLDGISVLMARMATEQAHALLGVLDVAARAAQARAGNDALRLGERRVNLLFDAVLNSTRQPGDGGTAPVAAHLDIVIDLPTLMALREEGGGPEGAGRTSTGAASLRGAGIIPAVAVRELLADPEVSFTMRRVVSDPLTGHLLDYGRRTYAVPDRLRDFIVARDTTCRFPGCNRRADRCQIDHARAWNDGGSTDPANLGALCVRHHQLKTHGGWQLSVSRRDGSGTWTSPQGRTYVHAPGPVHGPPPF